MKHTEIKLKAGLTLIELVTACVICSIIFLVTAALLVAGQRDWLGTFNKANKGVEIDALETMITFGTMGRKSNKVDYYVYKFDKGKFVRVTPPTQNPIQSVTGDAVEFRYWDTELNAEIMDTSKPATAYVLFYREDDKLMMDKGSNPPGGVNTSGNRITGGNVETAVLAEHITELQFSHTTRNVQGDGDGSIRMSVRFTDPNTNSDMTLKMATLMRNVWPY